MTHHDPPDFTRTLVQLDDQWLAFMEECAFFCEAVSRLLSDHHDLAESVRLGTERRAYALRKDVEAIGHTLERLRSTSQALRNQTRSPTD